MNTNDTKLYTSARAYFQGPDGMKNEVTMWHVAAGLMLRELAIRKGKGPFGGLGETIGYKHTPVEHDTLHVLDLCSGPGNFVNHLSFAFPFLQATCVDLNPEFLAAGQELFSHWSFVEHNASTLNLNRTFDCVTASSAYHHIEDEQKLSFLKTIKRHLAPKGFALVCENFLPEYASDAERSNAVTTYYDELLAYLANGNATPAALDAIDEVRRLEIAQVEEHKVPYSHFAQQAKEAGLYISDDMIVWQSEKLRASNAGSHVLVLRHNNAEQGEFDPLTLP